MNACGAQHVFGDTITVLRCCAEPRYKEASGIDKKELSKILLTLDSLYLEHRVAGMPVDTEAEFLSYSAMTKVCTLLHTSSYADNVCSASLILLRKAHPGVMLMPCRATNSPFGAGRPCPEQRLQGPCQQR
jgi:hypothetical protein